MDTTTHLLASMVTISSDGKTDLHNDIKPQKQVDVKINYPKEFNGSWYYRQGSIEKGMDENSAKKLVEAGIATIISGKAKKSEDDNAGSGSQEVTSPNYSKMNKAELLAELKERKIEAAETQTKAELTALLETDDSEKAKSEA